MGSRIRALVNVAAISDQYLRREKGWAMNKFDSSMNTYLIIDCDLSVVGSVISTLVNTDPSHLFKASKMTQSM